VELDDRDDNAEKRSPEYGIPEGAPHGEGVRFIF
jgi:hypothetical protein